MNDFLRAPLHVLPPESGCVIDCDTCTVRGDACADCVVSVMLGGPPDVVAPDEQRALGVLAGLGLVPPLQMTPPDAAPDAPAYGAAAPPAAGGDTAPPAAGPPASRAVAPAAAREPFPSRPRRAGRGATPAAPGEG